VSLIYLGQLHQAEILSKGVRVPASLAHAIEGAPAVLAAANSEADQIRREAEQRGYEDGLARGQAELANLLMDAHMKAGRYAAEMQPLLVDCAVRAVRMLMDDADPAVLIAQSVERVRERLADEDGLVLAVAPLRLEGGMAAAENLMRKYGSTLPIRVIANASLGINDWIIESPLGRAEVRRDHQLEQLRALIMNAFRSIDRENGDDDGDDRSDEDGQEADE
jgi:type III secretion protein L